MTFIRKQEQEHKYDTPKREDQDIQQFIAKLPSALTSEIGELTLENDREKVRNLLQKASDKNGWNSLHFASSWHETEAVNFLLENCSPEYVNQATIEQVTPLQCAIAFYKKSYSEKDLLIIKALLNAGAHPGLEKQDGKSAFHLAAVNENYDLLLSLMTSSNIISTHTEKKNSLKSFFLDRLIEGDVNDTLDRAVFFLKENQPQYIKQIFLEDLERSVNRQAFFTALIFKIKSLSPESDERLNLSKVLAMLNEKFFEEIVLVMESHKNEQEKNYPLHYAIERYKETGEICDLINPDNINAERNDGHTPLSLAILLKQWEVVLFLLSLGADHTQINKLQYGYNKGNNIIHFALAQCEDERILKALLTYFEIQPYFLRFITSENAYSETPIEFADKRGVTISTMVKSMLENLKIELPKKKIVNESKYDGIHSFKEKILLASIDSHLDKSKELAQQVLSESKSVNNKTHLYMAAETGDLDSIEDLLKHDDLFFEVNEKTFFEEAIEKGIDIKLLIKTVQETKCLFSFDHSKRTTKTLMHHFLNYHSKKQTANLDKVFSQFMSYDFNKFYKEVKYFINCLSKEIKNKSTEKLLLLKQQKYICEVMLNALKINKIEPKVKFFNHVVKDSLPVLIKEYLDSIDAEMSKCGQVKPVKHV